MSSNTLQNYHPGMITYATPSQPTGFLQAITSACPLLLYLPLQNRSVQSSGMYSQWISARASHHPAALCVLFPKLLVPFKAFLI